MKEAWRGLGKKVFNFEHRFYPQGHILKRGGEAQIESLIFKNVPLLLAKTVDWLAPKASRG